MIPYLLYYGVPAIVMAVTVWVGFLGWRFYLQEVVRGEVQGKEHNA